MQYFTHRVNNQSILERRGGAGENDFGLEKQKETFEHSNALRKKKKIIIKCDSPRGTKNSTSFETPHLPSASPVLKILEQSAPL